MIARATDSTTSGARGIPALLGVVLLVAAAMAAPADARRKPPLFGFNDTASAFTHHAGAAREAGQTIARIPAEWPSVERDRGSYDWSMLDPAVNAVRANGAKVLFAIAGAPNWAVDPACHPDALVTCPVAVDHDPDYVRFAQALVARYPGSRVQSWNEPNIGLFGDLSAGRAATLTNELAAALPGRVVGPAPSPADDHWLGYLRRSYRQTAPDIPLAVNLYPRSAFREEGLKPDWKRAVRIAERQGRRAWVTEIGFAASQYGAKGQAKAVSWAYDYLARHRAKAIIIHRLIDTDQTDAWQATLGMLRPDGSRTPAYRALRLAVRREARRIASVHP